MNRIVITTPPISVNRLYQGRRYLTKEGKEVKEAMAWEVKSQWKGPVIEDDIVLSIKFFVPNLRADLDNLLKATLDSLTGIIWKDDCQLMGLHCQKIPDKAKPRIELEISS